MAINGFLIGIVLIFIFKLIGYGFNLTVFKNNWLVNGFLGVSIYFGILQFSVYVTNLLKIPTKFVSLFYLFVLLVLVFFCFYRIYKNGIHFNKSVGIVTVLTIILTFLLVIRSGSFTIGSTSDSAFYMSMVNENAFTTYWQPFAYYSGFALERFNPYYDYQLFYHFFSCLEKLYAQFFTEVSYVPIYVWSALTCYIALLIDSALYLFTKVFKINKVVAILGLMLLVSFNTASWHLLYGYFGHSWRVGLLSILVIAFYLYLKTDERKWLVLISLSSSALISVMSSALFVNGFILIAFILVILANREKFDWYDLIVFLPTYLYLIVYVLDSSYLSYKLIPVFLGAFVMLSFVYYLLFKITVGGRRKIAFGFVGLLFVLMTAYGLIAKPQFSYSYFFGNYNNELSVPYFGFNNISLIITNVLWISGAIGALYLYRNKMGSQFVDFILISVVLFINPLVIGFVTQFLTKVVYYRYLETFINYYSVFFFAFGIHGLFTKFIKSTYVCNSLTIGGSLLLVLPSFTNYNNNPFYYDLDEPIDYTYRVPVSELEADLVLQEKASESPLRLNIVAQSQFTKAIVRNVRLLYDVNYTRSFCKMCNANGMPTSAPDEMYNLFMMRDFADQPIYQETINWDNACNAQFESNTKLLLIDKGQTKLKDGVYVQIWLDMRACNDVIFENDQFVVLEFR